MIMSMCGKDVESTYVSNTLTPINSTVMSSMAAGRNLHAEISPGALTVHVPG